MATAAKKAAVRRVYIVETKKDHVISKRSIWGTSGTQVLAYATKGDVTVRLAGQTDLIGLSPDSIEEAVETSEPAAAASA